MEVDIAALRAMYADPGIMVYKVRQRFRLGDKEFYALLKKHDIPTRRKARSSPFDKPSARNSYIFAAFERGISVLVLTHRYGLSETQVRRIISRVRAYYTSQKEEAPS